MAVTLFSTGTTKQGDRKPLFRAYKKIDNQEHQVYFHCQDEANNRQLELDEKAKSSKTWRMRNEFIQSEGVSESCITGGNIGIRHVYLRLSRSRHGVAVLHPSVQVSIGNIEPNTPRTASKIVLKSYFLSTHGWPGALYEAVKHSFAASVPNREAMLVEDGEALDQDKLLAEAMAWVGRNESAVAEYLWGMVRSSEELVVINSEYSRNSQMMYMSLRENGRGGLVLLSALPGTNKSKVIQDYDMLFHTAAYFTALQLMHREFQNDVSYESYAAGIYFSLKGEWLELLDKHGIPHREIIEDKGYDIGRWRMLVNQWLVAEHGDALLL